MHIITGLDLGGAERALYTLLTSGLRDTFGHHVVSLTGQGHFGPLLRSAGVPVTCLDMVPGHPTPSALLNLLRVVKVVAPSVIQGWMYHGNLAASLSRKLAAPEAALAWNIRQSLEGLDGTKLSTRWIIDLGARLSAQPAVVLYNSTRAREQHEARGYESIRSEVIGNGFDLRRWAPDPAASARLRQEVGLPDGSPIVGFVGRGHVDKDIPNLLSAFRKVSKEYPAAHLICVGGGIRRFDPSPGVDKRIIYLDQRNDIELLMPAFDLLCLSSRFEGFPNVIGEAMASAVPCVTTDVGDAARIVADTGWIAPARDSNALAEALASALAATPVERRALGRAARSRICADYSIQRVVGQYQTLYSRLVGVK